MRIRDLSRLLCLVMLLLSACSSPQPPAHAEEGHANSGSLEGQLLVATPEMTDPRFAHAVILIVDHDNRGAMGLVINRVYGHGSLSKLLQGFGIEQAHAKGDASLYYGGPVEPGRGFVLHSEDYAGPGTRILGNGVAFSSDTRLLQALADGEGPRQRTFYLGYAGWGPGQLESELARHDWMTAPADPKLIFDDDPDDVWSEIMHDAGTPI